MRSREMAPTEPRPGCPFCTSPDIADRLVAEVVLARAFLSVMPIVPGHALIIPKRCVPGVDDLLPEEIRAMNDLRKLVRRALRKECGAEGFHFAWNEGAVAGQTVPHVHLHVVPRKLGDAGITEYEPRQFLYRPGARAESPAAELRSLAEQLRTRCV
ncbi:HIT domain-containing protein [Candidatus Uhrbacteria bacterium]|nr:HIT domain-containing protein [Candidatus Uhrbacteria bacterium]